MLVGSLLAMSNFGYSKVHSQLKSLSVLSQCDDKFKCAKELLRDNTHAGTVEKVLKKVNPFHYKATIASIKHNLAERELGPEDKLHAQFANDAYKSHSDRSDFGAYKYEGMMSDENHSVYHNPIDRKIVIGMKGTSNLKDILPDLSILNDDVAGDPSFKDADDKYKQIRKMFVDHEISVTGHSLGGSKAMWVGAKNNVHSYAFNPGFNSLVDTKLDPSHSKSHVALVKGDPVSNSIMSRNMNDIKTIPSVSANPVANHSMSNFIQE